MWVAVTLTITVVLVTFTPLVFAVIKLDTGNIVKFSITVCKTQTLSWKIGLQHSLPFPLLENPEQFARETLYCVSFLISVGIMDQL